MNENNNFLIYKNKEGDIAVDAILKDETLWLTQKGMANVFGVGVADLNNRLNDIYKDGELDRISTVSKMEIVQYEGKRKVKRIVDTFNLDAIIAVGYRVNSKKATEFRIWANKIIKEHIIKGYTINTERFKNNGENPYFEELKVLNKLVSSYLDIAEINALNRKVMTMSDWLRELDDFLSLTHSAILKNKGYIAWKSIEEST